MIPGFRCDITENFSVDNGASIPPNLIAIANTESNGFYLRYCSEHGIKPHDARYPAGLPEYFIRMLTDPGEFVLDPFGGSCVTGEVCERLKRKWVCVELSEEFIEGAKARFVNIKAEKPEQEPLFAYEAAHGDYYKVPRPGLLWNGYHGEKLDEDGGRKRKPKKGPASLKDGKYSARDGVLHLKKE
jgi:hypothetical protein